MHFRILIFVGFIFSFLYADTNESAIFLDRYKIKKRDKQIAKNIVDSNSSKYKISNLFENNQTVDKNLIKQLKKRDSNSSDVDYIKKTISSKEYLDNYESAKDNLLYDKDLNWSKQLKYIERQRDLKNIYKSKEILYVVISSSMPKEVIKTYFQQAESMQEEIEIKFILRGFIGGVKKIMPTLNWIKEILKKNDDEKYNISLDINPKITKIYQVERVPCFIYLKNKDDLLEKQVSIKDIKKQKEYKIVYGAVPIKRAIKEAKKKKLN